jgi:hypothetical protein
MILPTVYMVKLGLLHKGKNTNFRYLRTEMGEEHWM